MTKPGDDDDGQAEARRRFEEDLAVREEAAPAGTQELPPGTTHEIEEKDGDEPDRVRRRRFSAG
jgi:hypothetical protein